MKALILNNHLHPGTYNPAPVSSLVGLGVADLFKNDSLVIYSPFTHRINPIINWVALPKTQLPVLG